MSDRGVSILAKPFTPEQVQTVIRNAMATTPAAASPVALAG